MNNRMNTNWKRAIGLAFIVLSLVSCGDKKNKTSSNTVNSSTPTTGSTPTNTVPYSTTAMAKAKSDIRCAQRSDNNGSAWTGRRLNQDYLFKFDTGNASLTSLAQGNAPIPQGSISGQTAMEFVGVGVNGDIMVVTKMTNGSQLIGYNVAVSMCEFKSNINNKIFVGDSIQATNMWGVNNGISLSVGTHCTYGKITSANVYIKLSSFSQPVAFSYYSPGCTNQNQYQY